MSTCETCSTNIPDTQKYCSKECYGKSISNKITKVCPVCNTKFETVPSRDKKYCSKKCFGKAERSGKYIDCDYCGEAVWKEQNELNSFENYYCSNECLNKDQVERVNNTCDYCGQSFKTIKSNTRKYCSSECSAKDKTNRVKTNCAECDTTIAVREKYLNKYDNTFCSTECRSSWLKRESHFVTNNPRTKDGKYRGFGNNWLEFRQRVRDRAGGNCEHCGKSREENGRRLSVHHIVPRSEYINSDEKEVEESNTMHNLTALCRSCHMKAEHNKIEVGELYVE